MVVVGLAIVEAVIGMLLIVRAEHVAAWVRGRTRDDLPGTFIGVYRQPTAYRIVGALFVVFAVFQLIAQG